MIDWVVEHLRLTAFPATGTFDAASSQTWFERVTGDVPEQSITQQRGALAVVSGPLAKHQGVQMQLQVDPVAVHWRLLAAGLGSGSELNSIGVLANFEAPFKELAAAWLRVAPALRRLAVGAVLVHPVQGRSEGHAELQKLLPAIAIPERAEDLLYQINRPRMSTIFEALKVNRVTKFSVGVVQRFTVGVTEIPAFGQADSQYFTRLETDLSTPADRRDAFRTDDDSLRELLSELWDMTFEISLQGDID